ncbi:class I adenylate-forming enzyme family protein [Rhodococcoides kroppenstedtii]|uniref:class I adenylate-forming enzyme family protein n=1 Tax=Rhodococcoides kroppenstedtii TaxID=293050 RepID=UPI0028F02D0D|nr:class I adenylate-forming enzyme family protein [Rhodococcus kroppenstedtii]
MSETLKVDLAPHHRAVLGLTMPEALDFASAEWGERTAIRELEGQERSLTWSEFRTRVSMLRSGLESVGVRPGDKIGVLFPNQIEFPLAWWAIVEAGAVIVPLNPKYTTREITFVLEDSDASWLIGLGGLIDEHVVDGAVGGLGPDKLIALGDSHTAGLSFDLLSAVPAADRQHKAVPTDIVNIQFTSGTTGLPKGCLLTHQYWIELGVYGAALGGDPQRLLADHPFYYMQNQAYMMTAVSCGAALLVTPGLSRRKFLDWLIDYEIDFAWVDEDMLEFPVSEKDRKLKLRKAPVAGMPSEAYEPMEARFGITCREWYASTEVGSGIVVPYDRRDLAGTGTMGFCLPNRESKIVDEFLDEVAPGVPGELCLRGSGMMLGYHNRPDVNAALFLPGGWFRTGDVATKSEEGLHYFVGRTKDMIRRSGENISAAEVEMHLHGLAEIDDVAVVPVPDPDREEEVKAIVVPADGVSLTADDVVEWARRGLAPFKVPRYVEFRAELPYTASGKIHKASLRGEENPLHDGVTDTKTNHLGAAAAGL